MIDNKQEVYEHVVKDVQNIDAQIGHVSKELTNEINQVRKNKQ